MNQQHKNKSSKLKRAKGIKSNKEIDLYNELNKVSFAHSLKRLNQFYSDNTSIAKKTN